MRYFVIILINLVFLNTMRAKELTFGVVPQQSPMKLIKDWQPIVSYLEKATGEK